MLLGVAPALAGHRIGGIEFFGYEGLDLAQIRDILPAREGGEYSQRTKTSIRQAVTRKIGKEPTDLAVICCDEKGKRLIFIGLRGASYKSFDYNSEPQGNDRLSPDILNLYARVDRALETAVRKGGEAAKEDDSRGYALVGDPHARSLQLAVRRWAVEHERELLRVLEASSAVQHRRVASDAMGYARQSTEQILALVRAARDSDSEVRNHATRALSVLVRSNGRLASDIPAGAFIEMLNSGLWSDRNKGASLLEQLTVMRNPDLFTNIRAVSLDSLIEMARWRGPSHAYFARVVLGQVAGLPEIGSKSWRGRARWKKSSRQQAEASPSTPNPDN